MRRALTTLVTSALLATMLVTAPFGARATGSNGLTVDIFNAPDFPLSLDLPWTRAGFDVLDHCTQLTEVPTIADMWFDAAPYFTGCQNDNVLAHFTGRLQLPESGDYQFYNASDDGLRVTLDGSEVLRDWDEGSIHGIFSGCGGCFSEVQRLNAGSYEFDAWWFDGWGWGGAYLYYSLNGSEFSVVPAEWFTRSTSTIYSKAPNLLGATVRGSAQQASYLWYRCTLPGSESTSLPKGCRSTGVTSKFYRVTLQDKRSGYLRVYVKAGQTRYYSESWSLNDVIR